MEQYSYGKSAAKNRNIVIEATTNEDVVPGCTRVIISGRAFIEEDYHRDMNHFMFEDYATAFQECSMLRRDVLCRWLRIAPLIIRVNWRRFRPNRPRRPQDCARSEGWRNGAK
ncbi:hypothetical protein Aduo_001633 [Ancylostoma duodenale]